VLGGGGEIWPRLLVLGRAIYVDFIELSRSWEAVSCSSTQELPNISWNPKVHYLVHKSLRLAPIMSEINPVHTTPSYLCKIHFNIIHPSTSWSSSGLFPCGFPTNILYEFLFSPIRATCPVHIFRDLIIFNYTSGRVQGQIYFYLIISGNRFTPMVNLLFFEFNRYSLDRISVF
jgi:hypothetical protein